MHSIHLPIWHEAVGHLVEVSLQHGYIHATLAKVGTIIMPFNEDHYQRLQTLTGKRIAILRIDTGYVVAEAV
ncbi:MAG: hypothetical protein ACP5FL_00170 [Thermoplasmatota archaeon]